MKKRLDAILAEQNYFTTKNKAHASILAGLVFINKQREDKPGKMFDESKILDIEISGQEKFVSRGGYKLEKALKTFSVDVRDKICMDVGCSTGGFTDCLLQAGAKKIYAVDVGYGQFAFSLRQDTRVVLLEKTNIRYLNKELIPDKIDLIVVDVSFISVKKFLLELRPLCNKGFQIIVLIKPQFESEKGEVPGGVIRDRQQHEKIVFQLIDFFKINHLQIKNFTISPVKGPKGNIEFLVCLSDTGSSLSDELIRQEILQGTAE